MDQKKELEYIRRIIDGDTHLYRYIVDDYSQLLFQLTIRIVRSEVDAEEIVQNTLMKAYRSLKKFKQKSSFSTWIYRIAYNEALNHTRKKKYEYTYIDEHGIDKISDEETIHLFNTSQDIEERIKLLNLSIEQLKPEEKALITFFYFEGKSIKDICKIISRSESHVKVGLHRTRKKLVVLYNMNKKNE